MRVSKWDGDRQRPGECGVIKPGPMEGWCGSVPQGALGAARLPLMVVPLRQESRQVYKPVPITNWLRVFP